MSGLLLHKTEHLANDIGNVNDPAHINETLRTPRIWLAGGYYILPEIALPKPLWIEKN